MGSLCCVLRGAVPLHLELTRAPFGGLERRLELGARRRLALYLAAQLGACRVVRLARRALRRQRGLLRSRMLLRPLLCVAASADPKSVARAMAQYLGTTPARGLESRQLPLTVV